MRRLLANRSAVVTGGAEGIGFAIARALTANGARVIVADLQDAKGEAAARAIGGVYRRLDVAREEDWIRLAADRSVGEVDILVNNAGINLGPRPFEAYPFEEWRRTMAVNLDGAFFGCRYAVASMAARGGAIVNITSATGKRVVGRMPAYSASKAAVSALTRAVALYCGENSLSIRCNAVSPGSVDTPLVDRLRSADVDPEAARARVRARHPIGFVGTPCDVASAVVYLVSDDARFITGAELAVDGGLVLGAG